MAASVTQPRQSITVPTLYQYDPDIGHRFIPNLKLRVPTESGGYLLRTNSIGFRNDKEFGNEPGRRRILIFGDSFTAGDGVSNGHRYSDVLERLLGAEAVEIHNFGLSGTGTDQQYLVYRKFAAGAGNSIVVMGVLVENIRRNVSAFRPSVNPGEREHFIAKPYFELQNGQLLRRHDPVPPGVVTAAELEGESKLDTGGRYPELRRMVQSLGLQDVVQRLTHYQPTPEYDSNTNAAWLLMRAILLEWKNLIEGPAVLFPIPLYHHLEETASPDSYRARFAELATEGGFILHDPLDDLRRYDLAERRAFRFRNDVHLTPAGHRALAGSLAKCLRRLLD